MASIFEQYEQSGGARLSHRQSSPDLITTSSFLNTTSQDEEIPIFRKQKINFVPTAAVTHLAANSGHLVMAMSNRILLWLNPRDPDHPTEVKLTSHPHHRVHRMFLDPTGKFLVISLAPQEPQGSAENLLLVAGTTRPLVLSRTKGHLISTLAWNPETSGDNSTSFILVGTSKGLVYETELGQRSSPDLYWKQVFDIGSQKTEITGLMLGKLSGGGHHYFVVLTTYNRMYEFVGAAATPGGEPPVLLHLFTRHHDIQDKCQEVPGSPNIADMEFFSPTPRSPPTIYAWMIQPGLFVGSIDSTFTSKKESVIFNNSLLNYPNNGSSTSPLGLVLTEFHSLVAYSDRVRVICVLNGKLIMDDVFPESYLPVVGIRRDIVTGTIWAYTETSVFRYSITREDRNIWEVYLEKGKYELARKYCKDQPDKLDKINTTQAQDFFNKKMYKESASFFALTRGGFEEVALRFVRLEEEEALRVFLWKKLEGLRPQDSTQTTMLVFWLLELYLSWLGNLRMAPTSSLYDSVLSDFRSLLLQPRVKETITNNCRAVYNLISKHGDEENLIHFINLMEDYQKVINYHLQHNNHLAALEVLSKKGTPDLFYKFSPALMAACPTQTVNVWIKQGQRLQPSLLIPALLHPHQNKEVMRYLEFCVFGLNNSDQAIHNFLLALYANQAPDKLMNYLQLQGQDEATVPYDVKYALRLCSELELKEACVHIYGTMGLYEEAVDMALGVNIELAKANADKPENNEDLVKKLWLKIAKHVVKEENDIQRAMEFLKDCDFIKIEDILPFFPDFVTIDHFKDAICRSLQEYNEHIENLIHDMDQATESAAEIKMEIQDFRNRSLVVHSEEKCSLCRLPILSRSFYLFPCQHTFHGDCLVHEVRPLLTGNKQARVAELQRELASNLPTDDSTSISSSLGVSRDRLAAELDDLVASECIFCGEIMIRFVDEPFIDPKEYSHIMKSWE